jgi:hypothetical protein
MGLSRRIEKCPQSGWGCMGGGATDQCLEGQDYPVQLYVLLVYFQYLFLRYHSSELKDHARGNHYDTRSSCTVLHYPYHTSLYCTTIFFLFCNTSSSSILAMICTVHST